MKRFKSRVDRWLLILLVASIVIDIAAIVFVVVTVREPVTLALTITLLAATAVLIASILVGTHYTVDREQLRIVSGPFRFRVRLDEIKSVKATRNPLSSPALSLQRLMIYYGNNRKIMVSPAEQAGFLRAIGQQVQQEGP